MQTLKVYSLFGSGGKMTRIDGGEPLPVGTVLRVEYGAGGPPTEAVVIADDNGPSGQSVAFECGRRDRVYPLNIDTPGIGYKSTGRKLAPEQVAAWVAKGDAEAAARNAANAKAAEDAKAELAFGVELMESDRPAWAVAAIVAEYDKDDSDSQSDYFAHSTGKTVFLAWSKHERDLFAEMRKGAARFHETAHLGPGLGVFVVSQVSAANVPGTNFWKGTRNPWRETQTFDTRAKAEAFISESGEPEPVHMEGHVARFEWHIAEKAIEHREKYSMGGGYYLKAGGGHWNGWRVCKRRLDGYNREAIARAFARGDVVK